MHKVVYNTCYGGFNLSEAAVEWLRNNARDEVKEFICARLNKYEAEEEAEEETQEKDSLFSFMSPIEFVGADLKYFLPRHDKDLVACVEALGNKASGFCSSLAICEIEGNMYYIEDYDGQETIITPDSDCFIKIEE